MSHGPLARASRRNDRPPEVPAVELLPRRSGASVGYALACSFAQVSFRVSVRLNTSASGRESGPA